MLWSLLCEKIGVSPYISIGNSPPAGMVVESSMLEHEYKDFDILEEYDPKPDLLNTAFYISEEGEDIEEEEERVLDEDYDW